jgi:Domain of unknown function (DUF3783)
MTSHAALYFHAAVSCAQVHAQCEQVLEVVGAYRDDGLPEAVFAAAVPRNYDRAVAALVDEVYDDDETMVRVAH